MPHLGSTFGITISGSMCMTTSNLISSTMFDSKFVVPLILHYVAFAAPPSFGYMAGFTFAQFVYDPTSQSPLGLVTIAMFCGFISGDGRVIYVANVCRAHGRVHILTVTLMDFYSRSPENGS
ncbi:hypothetical protein JG687_00000611 [Phytophthora cactorum]|uniref:Uncharacterized protein n=1 Tax=Phytophthora cactorum TaxID=29920 RepID=A0A8T1V0G8_9STRA|nr:hypothetical protein JG687_00000611 [Phytophthora cactorum]